MCQWGQVFWGKLVRYVTKRKMKRKETALQKI